MPTTARPPRPGSPSGRPLGAGSLDPEVWAPGAAGAGIILLAVAALLTVVVAAHHGVTHTASASLGIDRHWRTWMHDTRSAFLVDVAKVLDAVADTVPMAVIVVIVLGYLVFRRRLVAAVTFAGGFFGAVVVGALLKSGVDRARPPVASHLVTATGGSFPSGHSIAASACAFVLVFALVPAGRRTGWVVLAAVWSVVVPWSRTYLSVHWLTDAAAGACLGAGAVLLAAVVVPAVWGRFEGGSAARRQPARGTRAGGASPPPTPGGGSEAGPSSRPPSVAQP